MRHEPSLFTVTECVIGLLAVAAAAVLTLTTILAERSWTPSLGRYGSSPETLRMPNVVDPRPLSRAATS